MVDPIPAPAGRHHRQAVGKHAVPLELTTCLIGLSINMPPRWGWCGTAGFLASHLAEPNGGAPPKWIFSAIPFSHNILCFLCYLLLKATAALEMKQSLSQLLTDYGMILVLLLLCAFFSVVTYTEQAPTGENAARQVFAALEKQFGPNPRVFLAASDQQDDAAFIAKLLYLAASGTQVLAVVRGEPKDAREALQKIAVSGNKLDAIRLHVICRSVARFLGLEDRLSRFG